MVQSRIWKGMLANGFGQVVTAVIQLAGLPVFLHAWGLEVYGEWLVLTALAAYFTLGDLGFIGVAANAMTMQMGEGRTEQARATFQSTLGVVAIAAALMAAMVAVLAAVQAHWQLLPLHHIGAGDATLILAAIGAQVALEFVAELAMAGLRAHGRYALGVFASNLGRLAEFLAALAAVALGAGPAHVVVVMLAVRLASTLALALLLRRVGPLLRWSLAQASRSEVAALLWPSLAYMGFPLGNALSLQGVTVLIGIVLQPAAVVLFSTLRTLTRLVTQSLAVVNHSIWPEISLAFGAQDLAQVRALHQRSVQWSLWIALAGALALAGGGGWIVRHWTRGAVQPDLVLFGLLLLVMLVNGLWFGSFVLQVATNRHAVIAGVYVASSAAALALAAPLAGALGLRGVALALLAAELTMAAVVVRRSLALVGQRAGALAGAVLRPPGWYREVLP